MKYISSLILVGILISCGIGTDTQFTALSSAKTGIHFNNVITDSDSLNILNFEYIYNGGGVAIADFNGDNLQDIVFTGNMVPNALYINLGNMRFKDVSQASGIDKFKRWNTGVTLTDINRDGLMDIYISASGHENSLDKSNLLFVNQGADSDGIPTFHEEAKNYGINDSSNSSQSVFFDYDNDSDLDLLVISNKMPKDKSPSRYRKKIVDGSSDTDDHLYKNEWDDTKGHPVFSEVSEEAGILKEGYSLGVNICDINNDGWKDIFISNDYLSNDLFYINNQDGTFTDKANELFKHTSFSAMGNDVIDLDNDGDSEVIAVDMLPEDNYRRKTMLPPNKYSDYLNNSRWGFQFQSVRNTLQANNSSGTVNTDLAMFSDVAFQSGISSTDWSWTPLVADFDNDADRDIIITNGFLKDVTDRDFINYSNEVRRYASDQLLLAKSPSVKIKNYAFENKGDLSFETVTRSWGINDVSFSNGAAYGDLDNDGDIDYVVNNINDEAFLFQNNAAKEQQWLRIKLKGPKSNPLGIGAQASIYFDNGKFQAIDFSPTRGYLSCHEPYIHFGLGPSTSVDSIIIRWTGGNESKLYDQPSSQEIEIDYESSNANGALENVSTEPLFTELSKDLNLQYMHEELDFIDFNSQPLMLHKLSQYGPALSVGDVNSDGMDDLFISGSYLDSAKIYIQQTDGTFTKSDVLKYNSEEELKSEELGAIFFDADNDGDDDLYVVHGGNEFRPGTPVYFDQLYENQNGILRKSLDALPQIESSGLAVKAADFDKDGDLDLFVGGRLTPLTYPEPGRSMILRNISSNGKIKFEDITDEFAKELKDIGMVTDALWSDYDNDNDLDLLLVGELMSFTIFENENGTFIKNIDNSAISNEIGFWNSIAPGDFDNDGDIDYILGNIGENIIAKVSDEHPIRFYFNDFDDNGLKDLITTCYFMDEHGEMQEFPYHGSSDFAKQYNNIKKQYLFNKDYAKTSLPEIFSTEQMQDCEIYSVNNLRSSIIINQGDGSFEMLPLNPMVQRSPIYGIEVRDVNEDNNLDILMVGNDYGMEVGTGRLDAHDGLVGFGNGDGTFTFKNAHETGFFVQEDGKALVMLYNKFKKQNIYIASQNRGELKAYTVNRKERIVQVNSDDLYADIRFINGDQRREEFHFGSSFLSQSSRNISISDKIDAITIYNTSGESRSIINSDESL